MSTPDRAQAVIAYLRAELASRKAADARAALPMGSSRARVTSANAAWARAAEHRDRLADALDHATVLALRAELDRTEPTP